MPTIRDLERQLVNVLGRWGASYREYEGTYSGHARLMGPHVCVMFPEAYPPNLQTRKEVYGVLAVRLGTLVEFEEQANTTPVLTRTDAGKFWLVKFEFIG